MMLWSSIEKAIDLIAEFMGRIGWALVIYCTFFGVYDVFLRYVLNSPSLWISTTLQYAMVMLACVGGLYSLNDNAFVKLDLFYANFSARTKALCDIITVVFTFLFLSVLVWKGYQAAMLSIKLNQHTPTSIPLPIYPLKAFFPITGLIMLLIVIKKLVRDVRILVGGEDGAA